MSLVIFETPRRALRDLHLFTHLLFFVSTRLKITFTSDHIDGYMPIIERLKD